MSRPAVPSIPPLSSVVDPNARAVLQAMIDGQRIRNGDVGDGDEKFLTVADLAQGVSSSWVASSAGKVSVSTPAAQAVANVLQKLSDKIMQSRAWKLLDERIAWIATPEWFNKKFDTSIVAEQTIRRDKDGELAQQITTAFTNLNGNLAGVREEITAQSNATSALAQRVTTVVTDFNGSLGLVQQKLNSTTDQAGSTASSVTQLQTRVAGVDATAKESLSLASSVDGTVRGTKVIAFDLNGYIAGTCLTVDQSSGKPPTSSFVIRADTFAVGAPGAQTAVPFFVQGGATYIKTAMIVDASIDGAKIGYAAIQTAHIAVAAVKEAQIAYAAVRTAHIADAQITTAKIGDLQVDTMKIGNNAVTTTTHAQGGDVAFHRASYTWETLASAWTDVGQSGAVAIFCTVSVVPGSRTEGTDYQVTYLVPTGFRLVSPSGAVLASAYTTSSLSLVAKGVESGTYLLQAYNDGYGACLTQINMVLFTGKK